jgi:hypothetical protein
MLEEILANEEVHTDDSVSLMADVLPVNTSALSGR